MPSFAPCGCVLWWMRCPCKSATVLRLMSCSTCLSAHWCIVDVNEALTFRLLDRHDSHHINILLQLGMPRLRGTACFANVYALMFRMVGFASLRRGQAVTQPCRWQGHLLLHSCRHGIQTTDIVSCTMLLYLINRARCMSTLVRGQMFCNQNLWPRCQGPGSHVLFFQPTMWPLYVTVFFAHFCHIVNGVSQFISRTKSLLEVTCSFSQPQPVTSVPRA